MKDYALLQQKYVLGTYAQRGLTIIKGDGVYLYSDSGDQYLDCMTNYGVNILGHNNNDINTIITEQASRLLTLHGSFANDMRALSAQALVERCGNGLSKVYFSNSGAEANEAGLKFAVMVTGKKKFISAIHGYHGKTLGALSATYEKKYRELFEPLMWEFEFVSFNDIDALRNVIDSNTAGVILEPIQGEGGVLVPNDDYLYQVKELCRLHKVLLILDEVQSGMGRTGTFLASQQSHIMYDIVNLGKGLAGGLPVGATLVSEEVAKKIPKLIHSSTFGGNPFVCAGIIATLKQLNESMLVHVSEMGTYFIEQLMKIKTPHIKEVRGKGLMIGIELTIDRNTVLKALQKNHILAIPAGTNVVRFLPSYLIQKEHIDEVVHSLSEIFKLHNDNF
ncbi:MAG: aspartate aminotransferase family protein [Candidatus Roizmanbacteria bacterium]